VDVQLFPVDIYCTDLLRTGESDIFAENGSSFAVSRQQHCAEAFREIAGFYAISHFRMAQHVRNLRSGRYQTGAVLGYARPRPILLLGSFGHNWKHPGIYIEGIKILIGSFAKAASLGCMIEKRSVVSIFKPLLSLRNLQGVLGFEQH
jgi:hypothetical protein